MAQVPIWGLLENHVKCRSPLFDEEQQDFAFLGVLGGKPRASGKSRISNRTDDHG